MEFSFSEEQLALQELARQIFSDRMTDEHHRELKRQGIGFDRALWSSLADANLLGACLPEADDGMGLGAVELMLVLGEQGRTLAPVPLAASIALGALPLARFGSEQQRKRWLPAFISGEAPLSAAFHELAVGDPARPAAQARKDGGGWRIDGTKVCVPVADAASRVLVPARSGDAGEVGLFLVDPHGAGVKLEAQKATNGESQFRVHLEGAAGEALGDPHGAASAITWALDHGLAAYASIQLGLTEEALKQTAAYTTTRKQFGRPVGSFQGVQLRAADGYIDIECLRSTLWQAAWMLSDGRPASREVAVAKWWACRAGHRVVHTAMHLHGGTGADIDYPIHRYFLWSKQVELALGGAAQQRTRIGDLLAGEAPAA